MIKLVLLGTLLTLSLPTVAEELSMKTDVGKVSLTDKPCVEQNTHGFDWEAYATENDPHSGVTGIVHKGCWSKVGDIVSIWFYQETPKLLATYKDYYFKKE